MSNTSDFDGRVVRRGGSEPSRIFSERSFRAGFREYMTFDDEFCGGGDFNVDCFTLDKFHRISPECAGDVEFTLVQWPIVATHDRDDWVKANGNGKIEGFILVLLLEEMDLRVLAW